MKKTKFSQEQLLTFITRIISLTENQQYSLRNVDLCSKHNILLKNNVIVGHMSIIAPADYWYLVDHNLLKDSNYSIEDYIAMAQHPKKVLFLKYRYDHNGIKNKYKTMPFDDTVFNFGSGIESSPYLTDAIVRLDNNAKELDDHTNEVIEKTLNEVKEELASPKIFYDGATKNIKELVKRLNETEVYKYY